jgi:hypothetical protein
MPKPAPIPARIWHPMSFSLEVDGLMEYINPEPVARKKGEATRKG